MSLLNVNSCIANAGNSGIPSCGWTPGLIKGGFLAEPGFEIPASALLNEAALQDFLQDAILAPVGQRLYPLPNFEAVTNNTGDPTYQTLGYGGTKRVREGDVSWTFQYTQGGVTLNNELRKFNDTDHGFLFIDDDGALIGTRNAIGTGIKPIPRKDFYAYAWGANDGSNVTNLRLRFDFEPAYINDYVQFAKVSTFNLLDLRGLLNIFVKVVSRNAGVLQVAASIGAGTDAHTLFATQLADATLWTAKNANTKAPITITAVTSTPTGWQLTLDTSSAGYVLNNPIEVNLAAPTVLDGKGVSGFEGVSAVTPS